MKLYVILAVLLTSINAVPYFEIEDIPIEHFEHDEAQTDAFDVELMPRSSRALLFNTKYDQTEDLDGHTDFENIKTLNNYQTQFYNGGLRNKREVDQPEFVTALPKDTKDLVKELGKPLELSVIDPETITEKDTEANTESLKPDEREENNFLINDFIRFRRSTEQESMNEGTSTEVTKLTKIGSNLKNNESSLLQDQSEKIMIDPNDQKDSPRETRGATKEQWVKQTYPVRRNDEIIYNDNSQSSTENVRAPRVHFVTQGMRETAPEYKYEREARARDLNKEISRNLARDLSAEMDYYQPRYTRNYNPAPYRQRHDRYNYPIDPMDTRDPHYYDRPNDYPERLRNDYSGNQRQRRIIYYATLPDVSRTPPNVDLRERYDYRDRYHDDRFYSPESYPYRKGYVKPRYEEHPMEKSPYPVKVSTDLSVREVKKNPERRIYSDVDRGRYQPQANRM